MTKEPELKFSTSENAENANRESSSQIMKNELIKGTPFRMVGSKEHGYALTIGKYRLTDPKRTEHEVLEVINKLDWNIVANMIVIINKTYREVEEEEKKLETHSTHLEESKDGLSGKGPIHGRYNVEEIKDK